MRYDFPRKSVDGRTYRLVPSRFPPISVFEIVSTADDLEAVMELEGWTNDRLVRERLARLPPSDWVYGRANASVIMASFLHTAAGGLRFSAPELGAWYAGLSLSAAIAEVAHHLRREIANAGMPRMTGEYRTYQARLEGQNYMDIRGATAERLDLYDPASYTASQVFGEAARASGCDGIIYDSIRLAGGQNAACFRPTQIVDVLQTDHFEIDVRPKGKIAVRQLVVSR